MTEKMLYYMGIINKIHKMKGKDKFGDKTVIMDIELEKFIKI